MDDLPLVYDSRQFLEDHAAEIVEGDPVPVESSAAQLRGAPTVTPGITQQLPLILAGALVALVVAATLPVTPSTRPNMTALIATNVENNAKGRGYRSKRFIAATNR